MAKNGKWESDKGRGRGIRKGIVARAEAEEVSRS